ncbi:MAG: hypothetical protein Q7T11_09705 [Deltaproteobacteria bacterium]|nr:hypothetical protein [Deltaproteobacteria bacterium]
MKKILFILTLTILANCGPDRIQINPDVDIENPNGTIIGNPAPPQGTLKIITEGHLRYLIHTKADHSATVVALNSQGEVYRTAAGTFTLIAAQTNRTESLYRYVLEVDFSSGNRAAFDMPQVPGAAPDVILMVSLFINESGEITQVDIEINGEPAESETEFLPDEPLLRRGCDENSSPADQLVCALCTRVSLCPYSEISFDECATAINDGGAADIWDEFGLEGVWEAAPTWIIRTYIEDGTITANENAVVLCVGSFTVSECTESNASGGSLTNMENYVDDNSPCQSALESGQTMPVQQGADEPAGEED